MSAASKSAIFARIRAENGDHSADRITEWESIPRDYSLYGALSFEDRVNLFDERIRHYNGTPFYSTGDIVADLASILSERRKRNLVVPLQFPQSWLPAGFSSTRDENLSKQELGAADGVLTTCTLGIALTGTVVLE